ncbi:MAG: hypothetical protein ACTSUE_23440 [Promethearchaeota archaeon]
MKLLYQWFANPVVFFRNLNEQFKTSSRRVQYAFLACSIAIPVLSSLVMLSFWMQFAVFIVLDRFLTIWLTWAFFLGVNFGIGALFLMYQPIRDIEPPRRTRRKSVVNFYMRRKWNRLSLLRSNFYHLPVLVVFGTASLTNIGRPWNIFDLGMYIGVIIILSTSWVTVLVLSSLAAIQGNIKSKHYVFKVLMSFVAFLAIYIMMDQVLGYWMGAVDLPLWYKLADVFLHGQ